MTNRTLHRWIGVTLVLGFLSLAAVAQACPNCSSAVPIAPSKAGRPGPAVSAAGYSDGINMSIYFMIASIYTVMGLFGAILYRAYRNHQPGLVAIRLGQTGARSRLPAAAAGLDAALEGGAGHLPSRDVPARKEHGK